MARSKAKYSGTYLRRALSPVCAFAVIAIIPSSLHAYQVSCSTVIAGGPYPFTASEINGTFAEPRGVAENQKGTPIRFHAGTDIGNSCLEDHYVYPIEDGVVTVSNIPICPNPSTAVSCVRVTGSETGRIFDYVHVDHSAFPEIFDGAVVTKSSAIGSIQPSGSPTFGNHLHLNQIVTGGLFSSLKYRINPQGSFRLSFTDNDQPAFSTATIDGVSNEEIILAKGGIRPPDTFEVREDTSGSSVTFVRGDVDIFATASVKRSGEYKR